MHTREGIFTALFASFREKLLQAVTVPFNGTSDLDGIQGVILYHVPPYQAQLFICQPNVEIPDHSHPSVDTFLVYLSGQVTIRCEKGAYVFDEQTTKDYRFKSGSFLRVSPGVSHGLSVGQTGCSFISFQQWIDGPVRKTEQDWKGDQTLGPKHSSVIINN
jgi:quercetin dioxygenase-like cupin family protein